MTSEDKESTQGTGSTRNISTFDSASFLKNVTSKPGVYRMLDEKEQVILACGRNRAFPGYLIARDYQEVGPTGHLSLALVTTGIQAYLNISRLVEGHVNGFAQAFIHLAGALFAYGLERSPAGPPGGEC